MSPSRLKRRRWERTWENWLIRNGVQVIRELRDAATGGGGFVNYVWPKPGAGEQPKVSYAEMIPGTRMWIGTGVYLDNIAAYQKNDGR